MAALGLAISVLCVVLIARQVDAGAVLREMRAARPTPLLLSLLTKGIGFGFLIWRSWLLLRPVRAYRIAPVARSVFLAFLGNNILPFRAGELLRVEYLAREGGGRRSETLAVIVFERLLDSFFLLVLLIGVSPLVAAGWTHSRSIALFGGAVVAAIGALAIAVRFPDLVLLIAGRLTGWLGPRFSGFVAPRAAAFLAGLGAMRSSGALAGVLVATTGYWLSAAAGLRLWMEAFALDLPWYAPLVVILFLAFGSAIPSSPGFVGTYDYFAMQGLAVFGVPMATAASFAIVGHVLAVVPFSLLSLLVVLPILGKLGASRRAVPAE